MKNGNLGVFSRLWWMPLVTGLVLIGLGIWCLCDPSESLPVLSYVFAGCLTAAGCVNTGMALAATRTYSGWGWTLALGLLELLCGIWMLCMPMPVLLVTFMYVVGIWILVVAIEGICESCMLSAISPLWIIWTVLLLLATVAFAMIFLSNPILSGITEWIYLGIALITYGAFRMSFAFRLKSLGNRTNGLL